MNWSDYERGRADARYTGNGSDHDNPDYTAGFNDGRHDIVRHQEEEAEEASRRSALEQERNDARWEIPPPPTGDLNANPNESFGHQTWRVPLISIPIQSSSPSTEGSGWLLLILLLTAVGIFGSYTGYNYALRNHWSEGGAWLTAVGSGLGASLAVGTVLALVFGLIMVILHAIKWLLIGVWWLAVKALWIAIILSTLGLASWAITVASCRWLGLCRLYFELTGSS